jgi:hypothetical protein
MFDFTHLLFFFKLLQSVFGYCYDLFIMKKREEKEDTGKVKFSPLIMKIIDEENEEMAATVLILSFL